MGIPHHDRLREQFRFTIELALREALRPVGIRRQLTEMQMQVMSEKVLRFILRSNWKVRLGLPAVSRTGGTQEHNTAELG
jgi:hypothetical protein